jgi:hypothetical protein
VRIWPHAPWFGVRLLTQRAFFSWISTLRASAVVGISTDSTDVVFGHVPVPGRDGIPLFDKDTHDRDEVMKMSYFRAEAKTVYLEDGRSEDRRIGGMRRSL